MYLSRSDGDPAARFSRILFESDWVFPRLRQSVVGARLENHIWLKIAIYAVSCPYLQRRTGS
ncbi:hypothetical protein PhaeoP13_03777 (plasmid) [Phaeobacter piscinae]|uniref:Uncharacterized protein n=1 Tax=Phaeobacter piscinae TaxID=1580596 RepID=A0AAN1LCP6_9RHOB|nr:hypothetical protein PhaeoP13_03777 [Phaeobacter piscinae]